jgi:G3E family GTPase
VAVADRLVLTKTDLADADTATTLSERLRRLNPSAPLSLAAEAPLDAEALLSHDLFATAGRSEAARRWFAAEVAPREDEPAHDRNRHDETIHAFAFTFDGPLDWTLFGLWLTMLLNRHGEKLLRVKGILNVAGSPAPVAVHGVQHLVHPPIHMAAWPDADRRSRLVFIVDGLDRGLIERSLRAFLQLGSSALSPAAA